MKRSLFVPFTLSALLLAAPGCWLFGGAPKKSPEPAPSETTESDEDAPSDGDPLAATLGSSPEDALKPLGSIALLMTQAEAKKSAPEGFYHREFKGCVERSWDKPNGIQTWDVETCYEIGRLETCSDGPCSFVEAFEIEFAGFAEGEVAAGVERAWGSGEKATHPQGDTILWRSKEAGVRAMLFEGYRLVISPYLSAAAITPAEDGTPGAAFSDIWGQTMQTLQESYGERFEVDWDKPNRVNLGRLAMPPLEGGASPNNVTLRFDQAGRMVELVVEVTDEMKLGTADAVNKLLGERFPKSRQVPARGGMKPELHTTKAPLVWSWVGFGDTMRVAVTTKPKRNFF